MIKKKDNEYASEDIFRKIKNDVINKATGKTAELPQSSPETATSRGGRARPSKHPDKHTGISPDKGTGKHTDKSPDIYPDKHTDKHTGIYTDKHPDKHTGIFTAKSEADLEAWELDGIQKRSARFDLLWAPGTRDAIQAAAKAAKISTNEAINQILIRWLKDRRAQNEPK